MVTEDQDVDATITLDAATATFEVTNATTGKTAVVGTASVSW
jgi:hypothetical protein